MKKCAFLFLVFSLISCGKKDFVLEESVGETNLVTVIIEDALWNGEVGDSIRKKLTSTIEGLPQEEPLFSLIQHTDRSGDDHFCRNRNIIIVEKSIDNFFEIRSNDFALNQSVIYLAGKNTSEIIQLLEKNSDSIISTIQSFEITDTQKRITLAPLDNQKIKDKFGITLNIPSEFEYVSDENKFLWLKKEIQNGTSSLLIYEIPYFEDNSQTETISKIIKTRDSIGQLYIQSQGDEKQAYMITEEAYTPYFRSTSIDQKRAFQTKGTWEFKGVYMSGPFINYMILDKKNNRMLVLEGFAYAPSASKRNTMHELEAIIKSVKFD